ncbi:hypothetical protein EK904_010614 [Melospiza melodia maxima]|nr:hypothetical protein EK904_010614 [Melospiza melodia maxima]
MWRQIEFAKWGKNVYFLLWTEKKKHTEHHHLHLNPFKSDVIWLLLSTLQREASKGKVTPSQCVPDGTTVSSTAQQVHSGTAFPGGRMSGAVDLWMYWERLKHLPELPLWAEVLGSKGLVCLKEFSVHSRTKELRMLMMNDENMDIRCGEKWEREKDLEDLGENSLYRSVESGNLAGTSRQNTLQLQRQKEKCQDFKISVQVFSRLCYLRWNPVSQSKWTLIPNSPKPPLPHPPLPRKESNGGSGDLAMSPLLHRSSDGKARL